MKLSDIDVSNYNVLLLDRDGVINVLRPNDYVKDWSEFEFLPDVKETIALWAKSIKYIFVVTNQRGVGKGLMTEEKLLEIHAQMCQEIEEAGGRIDKIYYCTSISDKDLRRKPNIGMFLEILKDYPDIQKDKILMIGDSESDMQFAHNCGIHSIRFFL